MLSIESLYPKQQEALRELYDPANPITLELYGGAGFCGKSHLERFALIHHHFFARQHYQIDSPKTFLGCRELKQVYERHASEFANQYGTLGWIKSSGTNQGFHFHDKRLGYIQFIDLSEPDSFRGNQFLAGVVDEASECPRNPRNSDISLLNALVYCIRSGSHPIPLWLLLGSNPDGVGFSWLKKAFIERSDTQGLPPEWFKFIPATLDDRPQDSLTLSRKAIISAIENPAVRAARLEGSWDIPSGLRFAYRADVHNFVYEERFPLGIPKGYKLIIGYDWGLGVPFAALWLLVDPQTNDVYVIREAYRKNLTTWEQAQEVRSLTRDSETIEWVAADQAMWGQQWTPGTGKTGRTTVQDIKDALAFDPRFGPVKKASNRDRVAGFALIDRYLDRTNGQPNIWIDSRCANLIGEIEGAVYSTKKPDHGEIDDGCADHALTGLYFGLRSLQYPEKPEIDEKLGHDPAAFAAWLREREMAVLSPKPIEI